MNFIWKTFATGFGSGYSPVAPGTAGAIVACAILYISEIFFPELFLSKTTFFFPLLILTLIFLVIGILAANALEKEWGHDASKIVIDEMVGVWIAMLFIPYSLLNLFLAFLFFRIFDIWKPLGIRKMEQFKGGWGVMFDDVLAGIYANILLQLILLIL